MGDPSSMPSRGEFVSDDSPAARLWSRLLRLVTDDPTFIPLLPHLMTPDGRVHLGNGDTGTFQDFRAHAETLTSVLPDLTMDVEQYVLAGNRVMFQVLMSGTSTGASPVMLPGYRVEVGGAFVATVDDEGWATDVWAYTFPGSHFTFPATGHKVSPPAYTPGDSRHARALYECWLDDLRAGEPLDIAILRSLRPDGVVQLPNRDVGPAALLADHLARIRAGMPDFTMTLHDAFVHECWLIVQFTGRGTHTGVFGAYQPSGRVLPSIGMVAVRVDSEVRAAEVWFYAGPGYAVGIPPRSQAS